MRIATSGRLALVLGVVMMTAGTTLGNPMVVNGDFEADTEGFVVWPGYVGGDNPEQISGWTGDAGRGINPIASDHETPAPFRDNGDNDTHVAFLQGTAYIEQTIPGFSVGSDYIVSLDFNSRNCCGDTPIGIVSLNGIDAASSVDLFPPPGGIVPAGETNPWYNAEVEFTAPTEDVVLRISTLPAAGGDSTMLVDNVSVRLVPEPASGGLMLLGLLGCSWLRRRR